MDGPNLSGIVTGGTSAGFEHDRVERMGEPSTSTLSVSPARSCGDEYSTAEETRRVRRLPVRVSRATDQKVKPSQLAGRSARPPRPQQIRQTAMGASKAAARATVTGKPAATRMAASQRRRRAWSDASAQRGRGPAATPECVCPRPSPRWHPALPRPTASRIANSTAGRGPEAGRPANQVRGLQVESEEGHQRGHTTTASSSPHPVECRRSGGAAVQPRQDEDGQGNWARARGQGVGSLARSARQFPSLPPTALGQSEAPARYFTAWQDTASP